MNNSTHGALRDILESALGKGALPEPLEDATPLLGNVAELDSLAVITVLTRIQEEMGCAIADDEVGAETFETFGSLRRFVESKLD